MEKQTYKSHTTRQLLLHLLVRLKNTERLDFHPNERVKMKTTESQTSSQHD